MDIRPFIGRLEGEELDKQLAEADGFVDFGFSPAMIEKAPKLQIAASGAVPALVAVLSSKGEERRGAREARARA